MEASRALYPPSHSCLKPQCSRTKKGLLLKKAEARQAVLYTLDRGPIPVYSVHLYCEGEIFPLARRHALNFEVACHVNYHHNFLVENSQRTYYAGIPEVIQFGEHQFAERRLIEMWINLMLVAWYVFLFASSSFLSSLSRTSATNCARLYSLSHSDKSPPDDWAFGFTINSEHVWDGVVILGLLKDCLHRQEVLVVPHGGLQKDRFTAAVQARNLRIRLYGQPELRHHCQKCLRMYSDGEQNGNHLLLVLYQVLTINSCMQGLGRRYRRCHCRSSMLCHSQLLYPTRKQPTPVLSNTRKTQ
jgi:hypothetical protein